jgi:hypothetical protein
VRYVITANEPLGPFAGQLHFDVKLNGKAFASNPDNPE